MKSSFVPKVGILSGLLVLAKKKEDPCSIMLEEKGDEGHSCPLLILHQYVVILLVLDALVEGTEGGYKE
jgi:hypothetical protein